MIFKPQNPAPSKGAPEENHFAPDDTTRELDMLAYGDCYDPKAALRVRQDSSWRFDPDKDGSI